VQPSRKSHNALSAKPRRLDKASRKRIPVRSGLPFFYMLVLACVAGSDTVNTVSSRIDDATITPPWARAIS